MKRVVAAGLLGLAVSGFFTGCSSLVGSMEVDYEDIRTSAAAEAFVDENSIDSREQEEAPDYYQDNEENKFKELEGNGAFKIKEGHSQDDIEDFQIAELKSDKTFIYGYGTRVADGPNLGQMVHCGAMYQYESGNFQVFHENVYARTGEDPGEKESFFIQSCESGDIFIYDNGHGYIYDRGGALKFHGDIEEFIRKQFQDVYEISVVHGVTDGQNRIYLEVSIEKEPIEAPELKQEDMEMTQSTSVDDEAEDLDEELDQKVESRILVYEYKRINSSMDQENDAFEAQKNRWIGMTEGQEFEAAPDGLADWEQVVEANPDLWGNAYLGGMNDVKVYEWKGQPQFASEEGVTSFLPQPDTYRNFKDVKEEWELENLFIPIGDKYCDLFGRTEKFIYYDPQTIERQYTLVWYEEGETMAEGEQSEPVKHEQVYTQSLNNVKIKRYTPISNAYVESYWVMDEEKAMTLGNCIGDEIQCVGKDRKVRWIQPGGTLADTPYETGEDIEAGSFEENGIVYYVEFARDFMSIVQDRAHGGGENETPRKIFYRKLAGTYERGDSVYDAMLEQQNEENLTEVESVYGTDYYTEEQVLYAALNLNEALALELEEKGGDGSYKRMAGGTTEGFLLTSREKGLIFYDPSSEASAVIEQGTWFRTWFLGGNYVSVGFPKEETAYSSLDIPFARVYEYNLSDLCNESMRKSLKHLEAEEAKKQEEESRKQAEESARVWEEEETEKDPLDKWNEEHKKKYTRTYPSTTDESK